MSETSKIGYQFVPVPLKLFLCCDNNCRSVLTALIQLDSMYAGEDGWFFCSNSDFQVETNLSKNVLSAALDALYQKKIVNILPEQKGRGEKQKSRLYKLNKRIFEEYDRYSIETCMKHPLYEIKTVPYHSHFVPSFQKIQTNMQENVQTNMQKSDNHIDNIDNTENKENISFNDSMLTEEINFSLSSSLRDANSLYTPNISTLDEQKPTNGQQDAKRINSQHIGGSGLNQAETENTTVISTSVQGQDEYLKNLYKVASQAYGDTQANYATIISMPECYCDKALLIQDKSGDYLFEQYQNLNDGQGEQAFDRIVNALAKYRIQLPEGKKAVVDVFKYLLRRECDVRKYYQEQGLDYEEVYN